jgi:superfamily II DNA or RNA helicase
MMKLEELRPDIQIEGIIPQQLVRIVAIKWTGSDALILTYRRKDGNFGEQLVYRADEAELELGSSSGRKSFGASGRLLRILSEAYRIHLAYLFDPLLAIHTSSIEPLPHQITAVYEQMLNRHPLRFLLADDPGAGKTIMAGLLIKELLSRGDVRRCLICAPGNLTEQWQDELLRKFHLQFTILSRDLVEVSGGGNPFELYDLLIVRLDQLSRNENLQASLAQTDWDLVICDEAHKMAASFFNGDIKETKRYRLGKRLRQLTRHFLLMTATPHNGKEEDFQLFLALLDEDRFEGRFRDGVHEVDVSDLMRRMVKEKLLKFDGKPLFPERRAYTISYQLSAEEGLLYEAVTEYVRQEFDRAENLGDDGRKGTVGFALTILQRRLASSPEAIYQSLQRRRVRLEKRLQEARAQREASLATLDPGDWEEEDWEEIEDNAELELGDSEAELIDSATAARNIAELQTEILRLQELEEQARALRRSGNDVKWLQLRQLLDDSPEMRDGGQGLRKLVIFTEHRDTLNYLQERLTTLFGRQEALVCIHGGVQREERREAEELFRNDPEVLILLATDAAGEGINLQRAHLMVNYDLPWNPNRLEQRFGRIHRIGQTEVCHLWNLVAGDTREGQVYRRLLQKLEVERAALGGQVFDVLGKLFRDTPLRQLLLEAVRYGNKDEVRARLEQSIDNLLDQERVRDLLENKALAADTMDTRQIDRIRADMERAAAQRLQPHYIKAFFVQAFQHFGGKVYEQEAGRYTLHHVPADLRNYAKERGLGAIASQYERICFEKTLIHSPNKPLASFICPGHPLLDVLIDRLLADHRGILEEGAILVDDSDPGKELRVLIYFEQSIQDANPEAGQPQRIISRQVHFLEVDAQGQIRQAGPAPYLDYRPAEAQEAEHITPFLDQDWLGSAALEAQIKDYAIRHLVPPHLEEVRQRRLALIDKTEAAVHERLSKEIYYWDGRAVQLREQEKAGRPNSRLNSQLAQQRADDLYERMKSRKAQLAQERKIAAAPPQMIGRALIIPRGLVPEEAPTAELLDRRLTEHIAMRAVMEAEIALGNFPRDVSQHKLGYDIESQEGRTGRLRLIEVKGRRGGAETVTLTYNELYCALNSPEAFILALVEVEGGRARPVRYLRGYPFREPDPMAASVNFRLQDLLARSEEPQ